MVNRLGQSILAPACNRLTNYPINRLTSQPINSFQKSFLRHGNRQDIAQGSDGVVAVEILRAVLSRFRFVGGVWEHERRELRGTASLGERSICVGASLEAWAPVPSRFCVVSFTPLKPTDAKNTLCSHGYRVSHHPHRVRPLAAERPAGESVAQGVFA
jgi:hypothetical protein